MTSTDNIQSQIRHKANVVVLLTEPDDELSARAEQIFLTQEDRLRSRGFAVFSIERTAKSSSLEELACVRFPQLRFFSKGKLVHKIVGVFDGSDVDSALRSIV